MKPIEIILISVLVIISFLMADFLVNRLEVEGAFLRFVIRVGFQAQFFILIYLFFEARDNSRRLRELEKHSSGECQTDAEESEVEGKM